MKNNKSYIIIIFSLALIFTFFACGHSHADGEGHDHDHDHSNETEQHSEDDGHGHGSHEEGEIHLTKEQIETMNIQFGDFSQIKINDFVKATGTLDLTPNAYASISAKAEGFIKGSKKFVEGSYIKKGAVIGYLENPATIYIEEKEKEKKKPPTRSYDEEFKKAVAECRKQEESGRIMQCNTGGYKFTLDESKTDVIVDIFLPKNLDSSLIDVHAQPTFVCVVIKTKVLRLKFDAEVTPDNGSAKRSKVTGNLLLTFPKIKQGELVTVHQLRGGSEKGQSSTGDGLASADGKRRGRDTSGRTKYFESSSGTTKKMAEMMEEASKAVNIRGIAKEAPKTGDAPILNARSTKRTTDLPPAQDGGDDDDDDAPLPPSAGIATTAKASAVSVDAAAEGSDSDSDSDDDDAEPPPLE